MPPKISVIIPSYRRKEGVLALLRDVYAQEGVDFEVIVVDDCSPDDSFEAFQAAYPQATILRNEQNGGPCVTRNRGILAAKGEFIVGFDSDVTVPDRQVLRKTVETFQRHPEATGLAFRLLAPDGVSEDTPRWWHPLPISENAGRHFYTHYFSGTGYAFRRREVIDAGMYPEILYMHYEEVELAYRILDNGGSILYCPDIPVVHHEGKISRRTEIKTFYKNRNQILLAVACFSWPRAVAYLAPRLAFGLLQAIRHGHVRNFFRALGSARSLGRERMRTRRPILAATWSRIALFRSGMYPNTENTQPGLSQSPSA